MKAEARIRMNTEERREQLLRSGVELLKGRPHEDVSIEEIAAAAEVSKGLLYHYFPTKKDFILAALERGQKELAERLRPDPELEPVAQLDASLDAFLDSVEEHTTAYTTIFKGGAGDAEVAETLNAGRAQQLETLLEALAQWEGSPTSTERSPALETAVQGWLFFVEGAVLHWLEHGGLERDQLRALLRSGLVGALFAAAAGGAELRRP
jgi:AcrR family transcriptional regulator